MSGKPVSWTQNFEKKSPEFSLHFPDWELNTRFNDIPVLKFGRSLSKNIIIYLLIDGGSQSVIGNQSGVYP